MLENSAKLLNEVQRDWLSRQLASLDRQALEKLVGRTRARTWDPMITRTWDAMIKSYPQATLIQHAFRHVHVSSNIKITMEFSLVGIQGTL